MKVILLSLFVLLSLLYFPLNKRVSRFYWKVHLDNFIPLVPIFLIPYVLFFLYKVFSVIWLWNTPAGTPFLMSIVIAYISALVFWYIFPNGVKRMVVVEKSLWHKGINYLYAHDADGNGFPSAHVFLTLNAAFFIARMYPSYALSNWIFALLVCASTVLVKQHYILDVFGGILWSALSIGFVLLI